MLVEGALSRNVNEHITRAEFLLTRALLRMERTMNVLCH